jgi:hypothetical protein
MTTAIPELLYLGTAASEWHLESIPLTSLKLLAMKLLVLCSKSAEDSENASAAA